MEFQKPGSLEIKNFSNAEFLEILEKKIIPVITNILNLATVFDLLYLLSFQYSLFQSHFFLLKPVRC